MEIFSFSVLKMDLSSLNVLVYSIGPTRMIFLYKGSSGTQIRQIYVAAYNLK